MNPDMNEVLRQSLQMGADMFGQMVIAMLPAALGIFGFCLAISLVVRFFRHLLTQDEPETAPGALWDDWQASQWEDDEAYEEYHSVADGEYAGYDDGTYRDTFGDAIPVDDDPDADEYRKYMHDNHNY